MSECRKRLEEAIDGGDILKASLAIRSLQKYNALDSRDQDGMTPLMHACEKGRLQIVECTYV